MMREKFNPAGSPPYSPSAHPGDIEIKTLVSRVQSSDAEESRKAIWAISNLSRRSENRNAIVCENALSVVVPFLHDKMDTRNSDVLSLLTNLSQTATYRKQIAKTDALNSVVMLMRNGRSSLAEQGMEFVANMCLHRQAKTALIKEKGVIEILLIFLKRANDNGKKHVVRALVQLSSDLMVARTMLRMNGLKIFLDSLMTVEDWSVKAWLAELVFNLSTEPKSLGRTGPVCVWQMLELLDARSDRSCKIWALKVLGNLTTKPQLRRNVMRQGGIPLITSLLKNGDSFCVDEAIRCVANMTKDSERVNQCMRKGVLNVLLRLLEEQSPDALATVANVSAVCEQRLILLESGVVPLLIQFLKGEGESIEETNENQINTLRCLAHISDVEESISWFLGHSFIALIVQCLRSACLVSCSYAAHIIMNVAQTTQGIREVVESDAVWLLIRLTRCKCDAAVLSAVKALAVLSSNRHARNLITQYDGISELLTLMKENSDETKIQASKTLYALSHSMDAQRAVVHDGGIPTLIGMLSSPTFEVREQALCLLIRLGFSKRHWKAIKDAGGVGPMLRQLLVSELRDTVGVCHSFVKFFNVVILTIIKGHFRIE